MCKCRAIVFNSQIQAALAAKAAAIVTWQVLPMVVDPDQSYDFTWDSDAGQVIQALTTYATCLVRHSSLPSLPPSACLLPCPPEQANCNVRELSCSDRHFLQTCWRAQTHTVRGSCPGGGWGEGKKATGGILVSMLLKDITWLKKDCRPACACPGVAAWKQQKIRSNDSGDCRIMGHAARTGHQPWQLPLPNWGSTVMWDKCPRRVVPTATWCINTLEGLPLPACEM